MFNASTTREWTLWVAPDLQPSGIVVVFARTRTRLGWVSLADGEDGRSLEIDRDRMIARASWEDGDFEPGAQPRLRVNSSGEEPLVARVAWITEHRIEDPGLLLPSWVVRRGPPPAPFTPLWDTELARLTVETETRTEGEIEEFLSRYVIPPRELYELRRTALEHQRRAAEFFLRMDIETEPDLIPQRWQETMDTVSFYLGWRLEERVLNGAQGYVPGFHPLQPTDPPLEPLREVSLFLHNLVASNLQFEKYDLVDWAFERFATDELACVYRNLDHQEYLKSHGTPNGTEFFKFAELAFACVENDVDGAFWRQHLGSLVRSAHVFVEHAREEAPTYATLSDGKSYGFQEGRYFYHQRLTELRRNYAGLSQDVLEDRFTSLLEQAVPSLRGWPSNKGRALVHRVQIQWKGIPPAWRRML